MHDWCIGNGALPQIYIMHFYHNWITYFQEELKVLRDMFPTLDPSCLGKVLQDCDWDTTIAAERLLDETQLPPSGVQAHPTESSIVGAATSSNAACSSGTSSQGGTLSPSLFNFKDDISSQELLARVSQHVLRQGRYVNLTVPRERIWRIALGFYKRCMKDPEQLRRELRIEFEGEEGVDAGALRNEFFEILLREMNELLFEGRENSLPKDSNLQRLFECAGIIIAHSVLQGGPGFPCLCAAAVSYLLHLDKERALQELPTVDDIPQNAATMGLLDLISSVSLCSWLVLLYHPTYCRHSFTYTKHTKIESGTAPTYLTGSQSIA